MFGGHRHCSSEDIMFPVVEGQDFVSPRQSTITVYLQSTLHDMLKHTRIQNVDKIIVGMCDEGLWWILLKKLLSVRPEKAARRKRRKKTRMAIVKLSGLLHVIALERIALELCEINSLIHEC